MSPVIGSNITLLKGGAAEQLRTLRNESVHAVVCDPPYGLTNEVELGEMMRAWLNGKVLVNDADGYRGAERASV